jgi:non-ribosomal peptide synthetase component F
MSRESAGGSDLAGEATDRRTRPAPPGWVGQWADRRARLSPDRVGLVDATTDREFTYAELHGRANRTARHLADGVGSLRHVGVAGAAVVEHDGPVLLGEGFCLPLPHPAAVAQSLHEDDRRRCRRFARLVRLA